MFWLGNKSTTRAVLFSKFWPTVKIKVYTMAKSLQNKPILRHPPIWCSCTTVYMYLLSQYMCEQTICPFSSVGIQGTIERFFGNRLQTKYSHFVVILHLSTEYGKTRISQNNSLPFNSLLTTVCKYSATEETYRRVTLFIIDITHFRHLLVILSKLRNLWHLSYTCMMDKCKYTVH